MNSQLISINQRYKSSTRIDVEHNNYKTFIDDFILHGTAVNILDTLGRDFIGNAQRAYTITGPYGSGKSTLGLFLSSLLSKDKLERDYAFKKIVTSNNVLVDISTSFKINHGWNVIKHVCGLESPANSILISIHKALGVSFDATEINNLDDQSCLNIIKSMLSKSSSKADGFLLLIDEMGKALDFQARANKDLHLFQSLADISQQAKNPVILIGFLHQSFSDYAKNKDVKAQKEWAKVQGRYRDLSFNPSIDESLVLVGDSLSKDADISKKLELKYETLISNALECFQAQNRNKKALTQTLPLDPLVSLLLGPISRRRFSQNERSLFGFLASHEKLGFREFLLKKYSDNNSDLSLYLPEQLWDYLHHNLHHQIISSHDSKAWLEGCDAIYRAGQKGNDLHIAITKLIALLTIFGFHYHLHAKKAFISAYFVARGLDVSEVDAAIHELESWTVVIYRQKHDALFIFQGSDIDVNNLLLEKIESVSQGYDWTSVCNISESILATAHYHKTGTMRWANTRLVADLNEIDFSEDYVPLTGEPFLNFLLPTDESLSNALSKQSQTLSYAAIGQIETLDSLKAAAFELIALKDIVKHETNVTHDLIAKKELETRIKTAQYNVERELNLAFRNAIWSYRGARLDSLPLPMIASQIADDIFDRSPEVINELINRSKPSGSANSALRKLMIAMLEDGDKEDLNFPAESFPPEKGLYLSCLKSKGWHIRTEEGFVFPNQAKIDSIKKNVKMNALWSSGFDFIKNSKEMVTMDEIYTHWMKPPFGLTAGLCRVYGLALLKSLEGQVAFYDLDSTKQFIFIPELDEELVTKIYKHPTEAGVRYYEISEIQTHLLDTLAKATIGDRKGDDVILGIAKHIVKIVHTLPAWVKKTSGESFSSKDGANGLTQQAREFRNKVLAAHDPYKLILDDLPEIFQLNIKDPDLDYKLAQSLKTAIEDLSAQHDMLLSGFMKVIEDGLGAKADSQALKVRCERVFSMAQRPNVKELASRLIKFIDTRSNFEQIISLSAGVSERNWTDKHLRIGLDELQTLCIQFRRIESFSNVKGERDSKPLSFITSDKSGNHIEYSAYINYNLDDDKEVILAIDEVKSKIAHISKEKQLAALSSLLSKMMEHKD